MKRPFKVGDRVRVYFSYDIRNSKVKYVHGDGRLIVITDKHGSEWTVHEKQCRRLKPKKKPREWQILFVPNAANRTSFHNVYPGDCKVIYKGNSLEAYELVRVREVL